jgi:hypothetical protein
MKQVPPHLSLTLRSLRYLPSKCLTFKTYTYVPTGCNLCKYKVNSLNKVTLRCVAFSIRNVAHYVHALVLRCQYFLPAIMTNLRNL